MCLLVAAVGVAVYDVVCSWIVSAIVVVVVMVVGLCVPVAVVGVVVYGFVCSWIVSVVVVSGGVNLCVYQLL